MKYRFCRFCGRPALPKEHKKNSNEFDHTQGCPGERKPGEGVRAWRKRLEPNHIIFHPLYDTWRSMKRRCYDKRKDNYARYGGRGITVCDRWRNSFRDFLADMGPRPSPSHSVERINNDGNYEPGNCRWATPVEQAANRLEPDLKFAAKLPRGWTKLAKKAGLRHGTVMNRVIEFGWTLERALSTPPNKQWDGSKHRSYPKKKEKTA